MYPRILLTILIVNATLISDAQYVALKMNLPSLVFRNLSMSAELGLNDKMAFNMGGSFKFASRDIAVNSGLGSFRSLNSGFSLSPELRFYFSQNGDQGSGFYLGPYMRYSNYWSSFTGTYYDYMLNKDVDVDINTSLSEFGVGVQIGYQILLHEHFVIDLVVLGPRISSWKFVAAVETDMESDEFFEALGIPELDESGFFGFGNYSFTVDNNGAKLTIPLIFPAVRIGLVMGYKF